MTKQVIIENYQIKCPYCKTTLNKLKPNVEAQSIRPYKHCPKCRKEVKYDRVQSTK